MRIKFLSVILSFILLSVTVSSCLSSSNEVTEYSTDATIRAFGIDTIGKGKYYRFNIDQLKAEIYNVDSLPLGADTIIDKILIDTLSVTGWVTAGLKDTLFTTKDSVDLREPLKLKVHSADGSVSRVYTITVAVHQQDPDSLIWKDMSSSVPGVDGKQKSVIFKNSDDSEDLIVYTSSTTAYRSSLSNPASIQWSLINVSGLPDDAELGTIICYNSQLYVAEGGKVYTSLDGETWNEVASKITVGGAATQDVEIVALLAWFPGDNIKGTPQRLMGVYAEDGKNYFCVSADGETWEADSNPVEVAGNFPLRNIYSTVFTNGSGIKQSVIVGNVGEAVEKTVPWLTMDGLNWVDMSTSSEYYCPAMNNPSIMYYGGMFHIMGGSFDYIRSSTTGLVWNEAATKFRYPSDKNIIPGEDEDDEDTIEYISRFLDKGDYSLSIDSNHYIWLVWSEDGSVWRARLNKLGFKKQ